MVLSDRLHSLVNMVPKTKTVADIGCDHGKAAAWLVKNATAEFAICADISKRSLEKARRLAESYGLNSRISFREGNGFEVFSSGEVEVALIAGMGGDTIKGILKKGCGVVPNAIVLSCNSKADVLRQWLCGNGFIISDEELIYENKMYYPVISAHRGGTYSLSKTELEFGPVLLKKKPEILKRYVESRINAVCAIQKQLKNTQSKRCAQADRLFDEQLNSYNEVKKCL